MTKRDVLMLLNVKWLLRERKLRDIKSSQNENFSTHQKHMKNKSKMQTTAQVTLDEVKHIRVDEENYTKMKS